jgi:hypothetical protein
MTVWTSAWLHGVVAADDVLDALEPWAGLHEVIAADEDTADVLDLPEPTAVPVSPAMLLAALRRGGATTARLMLPVPGDVRGLGAAHGAFGADALREGQAVILPDAELGVVPVRIHDGILRWTVHRVSAGRGVEHIGLAEAEHALRGAVREAAATLTALDIARHRPEVRQEIAETLANRPHLAWPARTPGRALRVLEQADEVAAILAAAAGEEGAAVSASEMAARSAALRPLASAVRSARLAAVAEAVRALTDHRADHH